MMATVEGHRGRRGGDQDLSSGSFQPSGQRRRPWPHPWEHPGWGWEDVTEAPMLRAFKMCEVLKVVTEERAGS